MDRESIAILLQMYGSISSNEANLWMMYVAACLACAGFGVTTNTLTSLIMGLVASVGFLAFAYGQFVMVEEMIRAREIVVGHLQVEPGAARQLAGFIEQISRLGLTRDGAMLTHVVVDTCIVVLILFRPVTGIWVAGKNEPEGR